GRHPLPPVDELAARFGQWGIESPVQVVAYDQGPGAYAARLWWLLRWLGHTKVAVLDGGFAAWQEEKLPLDAAPLHSPQAGAQREPAARRFDPRPDEEMVVATTELEGLIASG